jgi:hydrogenase maturation protease
VPGSEVEQLPALAGLHSHQFRWDHSLAFAHWLLKDRYPTDITVFLIEAESCHPGAELTPKVAAAMEKVGNLVLKMCEADEVAPLREEMAGEPH